MGDCWCCILFLELGYLEGVWEVLVWWKGNGRRMVQYYFISGSDGKACLSVRL
jgi:hypothetical protein